MGVKVKRVNRFPDDDGVLARLRTNTAMLYCILLLIVGVSSVAFLRYKRTRKPQRMPRVLTRSSRTLQGCLKTSPSQATYSWVAPTTGRPFASCVPPATYEEARHTACIFLVPTTEEDRIRASRIPAVSFIKELPYGAPHPPNAIPLYIERRDRPFWNYPNVPDRRTPPTNQTSTVNRDTKANYDTVAISKLASKPQVAAVITPTKQGQDSSGSVSSNAPVPRSAPTPKQSSSTSVAALPATSNVPQAKPSDNTQAESANAGCLIFSRNQPSRKTLRPGPSSTPQNVQQSSVDNSARATAKVPETSTETLEDRLEAMKDMTMQCLEALAHLSKKAQTLQAARKSAGKD